MTYYTQKLLLISLFCLVLFSSCRSNRYLEQRRDNIRTEISHPVHHSDSQTKALYDEVQSWLGTPYRLGGNDKRGVDCSGLVCQIYARVYGKQLHRRSIDQYTQDIRFYLNGRDLRPGNLVFFSTQSNRSVNHVGVYLDHYKFVHASGSKGVVIDDLRLNYFVKNWIAGGEVK